MTQSAEELLHDPEMLRAFEAMRDQDARTKSMVATAPAPGVTRIPKSSGLTRQGIAILMKAVGQTVRRWMDRDVMPPILSRLDNIEHRAERHAEHLANIERRLKRLERD